MQSLSGAGSAPASSNNSPSISAPGIGSGLDVNAIVSKLMAINSQPLQSIKNQQASYQTQLSAFGMLNGALSAFQHSLATLGNASTFNTLTASSSNSAAATATVGSSASTGNYALNITQLAQAQSISSAGQVSETAEIGGGGKTTISFQFGSITGTANNGSYKDASFTADPTQALGSVTIDSSNNSLRGIAAAINAANVGVQASIVGDGSATPYHLILSSAKTGANSSMHISVSGDAKLGDLLNYDPAGAQNLKQISAGQNANMTINGIAVTSTSNTVDGSVKGVSFTAVSTGNANINVNSNTAGVTNAVNALASAYNSLNTTIAQLTAFNPTTKVAGPLLGNPTIQAVQAQIRGAFNTVIGGSGANSGNFSSLTQIGVNFQNDGSLNVDSAKLQSALNGNFKAVGALFSSVGTASDSLSNFVSSTSATQAGSYPIHITNIATHGTLVGNVNLNKSETTIEANTSLNATVDGTTAKINLPAGTYTGTQLATLVQSAINTNSNFSNAGLSITATIDANGNLRLQSQSYGKSSAIALSNNTGTSLAAMVGTVTSGTQGTDVAGTINGLAGVGNGQFLTAAAGSSAEGLQIQVAGGTVGARGTVNYSRGYAYQLNNLVNSHVGSNGTLSNITSGLNSQISTLQNQANDMQTHLNNTQRAYLAQFSALDTVLARLQGTQNFLTSQLSVLNGSKHS